MSGCDFVTRAGGCMSAEAAYNAGRAMAIYSILVFIVAIWCLVKYNVYGYEPKRLLDRIMNWWTFAAYTIGSLVALIRFMP